MGFLDSLTYRPNRVPQHQRYFQKMGHLPVHLRGRYDPMIMKVYWVAIGVGAFLTAWGYHDLVRGKGKKEGF